MIKIVTIPETELIALKKKTNTNYWRIFWLMATTIFILCILTNNFIPGLICVIIIASIFLFVAKKQAVSGDQKIIRQGIVTEARFIRHRGKRVSFSSIEISLTPEVIPDPYVQNNNFMVYHSFGNLAFTFPPELIGNLDLLKGRLVEIEYMPLSGFVINFRHQEPFILRPLNA